MNSLFVVASADGLRRKEVKTSTLWVHVTAIGGDIDFSIVYFFAQFSNKNQKNRRSEKSNWIENDK